MLKRVSKGELEIESLGEVHTFGEPFVLTSRGHSVQLKARVKVLDEAFWTRVFTNADFGFAGKCIVRAKNTLVV